MARFISVRLVIGFGALVFAALAFLIFAKEYKAFYAGAGMDVQFYIVADDAFAARPYGLQSTAREIERCFGGMQRLQNGVLNGALKARGYQACLSVAQGILARSPTHGAAHQLRAESLYALGDAARAMQAAAQAARAAPNSAWLAQRRLALLLAPPLQRDVAMAALADADLVKLMRLHGPRAWLAGIYASDTRLRPIVARNQAQISADDAAQFLRAVRGAMAAMQSGAR
ncbi:MAG: hypothetical protein ACK4SS_02490 [Cypionkella sp.]